MLQSRTKGRFGRVALLAGIALGATVMASGAFAGECPADQKKADARAAVDLKPVGVTDTVIATIDVEQEQGIDDRKFRMRKLVIEPGGIVPWHSHADRPALIYVVSGEITEYASTCSVPIVHKAGDSTAERHGVAHWWKNTGKTTAVLISADLLHVNAADPHMM